MADKEQWLVRVNLVGVHGPVRMTKKYGAFTGLTWWESKCGEYDYYGKPANEKGCRDYVFNDKASAKTFHKGAQAVLTALRDFAGG